MKARPYIIEATCFKELIRKMLEERRAQNVNYSLRKFANDLNVSPSTISELLNDKHVPSLKSIKKIAHHLGLVDEEYDHLVDLTLLKSPYNDTLREGALNRIKKRQNALT